MIYETAYLPAFADTTYPAEGLNFSPAIDFTMTIEMAKSLALLAAISAATIFIVMPII
jgi:hypothetical protein